MNAPSANHTLPSLPRAERRALRVAVLAPPWIPVPPPAYGGIERRTPRFARNGHALPRRDDAAAERGTHRLAPAPTLQP
ncbi:MAG: hypothetical protein WA484_13800, partial [Solirubrobacteraceae bacterium]